MNYLVLLLTTILFVSCGKDVSEGIEISTGNVSGGEKLDPKHVLEKSIVTIKDSYNKFKCTGTILTRNSVLAAAHCFNYGKYTAVINSKTYALKKYVIYPEYGRDITLDIAVGILETEINPQDFYPVTLDANETIPKALRVIGRSEYITTPYTDYVQAILVHIPEDIKYKNLKTDVYHFIENLAGSTDASIRNKTFESYTKKIYRSESLNDPKSANIYFNNFDGGPLPGDSGGPVFVENIDGSYLQRGVSQFVKMNYQYPIYSRFKGYHVHDSTAYANINYYLQWLNKMAVDFKLGELKTSRSIEKKLSACEEVKLSLNQLFIEKLGLNLIESTISNNCKTIDHKVAKLTEEAIVKCQKVCGLKDQTCMFSDESMKTYKSFLKILCSN